MQLTDVFIVENLQILEEGSATKAMKIRGVFQRADEENNNKRIYPRKLLEREVTKLMESLKDRRLLGELDHPQNESVKLSNVSHLITGLSFRGNDVIGEAELLNTPAGQVAQALVRAKVKVGISSRGMGTLSEGEDGKNYVNEDFNLVTWDLVADPSTRGAFPELTESTKIKEIIDTVLPEAQKMNVFRVLLEQKISEGSIGMQKALRGDKQKARKALVKTMHRISNAEGKSKGTPGSKKGNLKFNQRSLDIIHKKKAVKEGYLSRVRNLFKEGSSGSKKAQRIVTALVKKDDYKKLKKGSPKRIHKYNSGTDRLRARLSQPTEEGSGGQRRLERVRAAAHKGMKKGTKIGSADKFYSSFNKLVSTRRKLFAKGKVTSGGKRIAPTNEGLFGLAKSLSGINKKAKHQQNLRHRIEQKRILQAQNDKITALKNAEKEQKLKKS